MVSETHPGRGVGVCDLKPPLWGYHLVSQNRGLAGIPQGEKGLNKFTCGPFLRRKGWLSSGQEAGKERSLESRRPRVSSGAQVPTHLSLSCLICEMGLVRILTS